MSSRQLPPSAAALMESLRGTGYSLESALADLIDNSITADARNIDIAFDWMDGRPQATIRDDGTGLYEKDLFEAMRFGGTGAFVQRSGKDLGRFGLGLKTASLSQCRCLTAMSRRAGATAAFTWDLDHIRNAGGAWDLLEGLPSGLECLAVELSGQPSGTIIIWDRIDFGQLRENLTHRAFLMQLERAEKHLSLVFHRYLGGDAKRVRITLNGRIVIPWDPFLSNHAATGVRPEQQLVCGYERVAVRGYVLPHPDRFANTTELEVAAGPDGWAAQQGFYVYRQKRLLSGGGWLGLAGARAWQREEFSRLARIRIDLPNSIDEEWRIDIRKSQARPPEAMREPLARIAGDVRMAARAVFQHRGRRFEKTIDPVTRIWQVNPAGSARRYVINREHPLVQLVRGADGGDGHAVEAFLDILERTVPIDRIWLDTVENGPPPQVSIAEGEYNDLLRAARGIMRSLIATGGKSRSEAAAIVACMEPFDSVPDLAVGLQVEDAPS